MDLVMSDGRRMSGVQVLAGPGASARTGSVGLPEVPEKDDKWDIRKLDGQDMVAIVDFVEGIPIVMGFLYPQISQMTFADKKLELSRHQSDVIRSIDGDGNIQLAHPGGTYMRIGESPDLEDYSGRNFDETLELDRNTDKEVTVRLGMAGGVMTLTISPDGTVDLVTDTSVNITATDSINFDTPLFTVSGDVTVGGGVVAQGDVIGASVSLSTHLHIVVGAITLVPIPLA